MERIWEGIYSVRRQIRGSQRKQQSKKTSVILKKNHEGFAFCFFPETSLVLEGGGSLVDQSIYCKILEMSKTRKLAEYRRNILRNFG